MSELKELEEKAKLDWKNSDTDLLKLLGLNSSLSARSELAKQLGYQAAPGDVTGSAAMNEFLHDAILKKLGITAKT